MQRLRWSSASAAFCAIVLLAACAAEPLSTREHSTRGDAALGDALAGNEMQERERREEETQREIEAHDREIRRQRAEIDAMRRDVRDDPSAYEYPDDRDDSHDDCDCDRDDRD
jgi:hypothetical protein